MLQGPQIGARRLWGETGNKGSMQPAVIPSGEVSKCQALHVETALVEGLQGGWGEGSKGDQGVHQADILLTLQMEATAVGGLEVEASRGEEVLKGFKPAVGEQEAIFLEWQLVERCDRTHF